MKKIATWVLVGALCVFLIDWGVMGLKIATGDLAIEAEAYIGAACFVVIFVAILCRALGDRCPHCGKMRVSGGKYCPYCGKER